MNYSFDLFDTLVTRKLFRPEDIFLVVGHYVCEKFLNGSSPQAFAKTRILAEHLVRERTKPLEVTLDDIYLEMKRLLALDSTTVDAIKESELEVEISAASPILENVERLHRASPRIVISDTYLPETCIRQILVKCGIDEIDFLYCSSTHRLTKVSGNLFKLVEKSIGLSHDSWTHVGDNVSSDWEIPKRLGINAELYVGSRATVQETNLCRRFEEHCLAGAAIAGAMKAARLLCGSRDELTSTIWRVGANVVGPTAFALLLWVNEEAKKRHLDRLYFLARDGQVLYRMSNILRAHFPEWVKERYLLVSRQSLHLPALADIDASALDWILSPSRMLRLQGLFARVGLTCNEYTDLIARYGLSQSLEQPLSSTDYLRARRLFADGEVVKAIRARAADAKRCVKAYFAQEGLDHELHIGIVDLGWNGRIQRSLGQILGLGEPKREYSGGAANVTGFYLGLHQKLANGLSHDMLAYLFSPGECTPLREYVPLLELLFAGNHASVQGYKLLFNPERAVVVPVLGSPDSDSAEQFAVIQHAAAEAFAQCFSTFAGLISVRNDLLRNAVADLLYSLMCAPDPVAARCYGAAKMTDDQAGSVQYEVAPNISLFQALMLALGIRHRVYPGVWAPGSLSRSGFGILNGVLYWQRRIKCWASKIKNR